MGTRRMTQRVFDRRAVAGLIGAGVLAAPRALMAGAEFEPPSPFRPPSQPPYDPPTSLAMVADIYRRMTAPIKVNGQGPYPFVVDTGANRSVISEELAGQLGLPPGPSQPVNGVAGVRMAPTTVATLTVGARSQVGVVLSILPGSAIGAAGMLGLDRLEGQQLTLDFRGRALHIDPPGGSRGGAAEMTMKARRRDGQLILVDVDLAGIPLVAFLDSGAQNTIGNMALRARAIARDPDSPWARSPVTSVTGQVLNAEVADLPRLRVGGMRLPNWPVAFADLHTFRLWKMIDKPAILMGVDVLSRFESVCLDFARNEVRFRLPRGWH